MKEELYDILLDSSQVDLGNSKLMLDSEQYFFSISLCFQSIMKLLSIVSIHIENKELEINEFWKGYVLSSKIFSQEVKDKIVFVGETFEDLDKSNELSDDEIKEKATNVYLAASEIMIKIKQNLMGRSIMFHKC